MGRTVRQRVVLQSAFCAFRLREDRERDKERARPTSVCDPSPSDVGFESRRGLGLGPVSEARREPGLRPINDGRRDDESEGLRARADDCLELGG